jgi:hypothetical protein
MTVMDYQTRDGLANYGFSIEFQSRKGWRIYIIFDPLYKGEDESPSLPYQALDDEWRRYVNWGSKLDSLADAKTVAGLWAEIAQRYVRIKEEHKLYVELIEHYQCTQKQRRDSNETAKDPSDLSEPSTAAA